MAGSVRRSRSRSRDERRHERRRHSRSRRSRSRSRDERRHERRRHSRSRRSRSRSRDERRHERRRHSRSRRSRSGDEHRHERRRHSRSRRSRSGDGRRHSRNRRSRSRENRERTHPQQPHPCRAEDKKPKQSKTVDENPKQIKTDERQLGLRQTKEKQPSPRHTEEEQPHQGPEKPLKGLSSSKVTQRTLSPICEISAAASVKEPNQREKRQRQPFADFKPRLISSRTRSGSKEIDSVDPTSPSRSRSRSFDPFICDVNDIGNVDENPESDKTKATEKTTHHSASYRVLKENLLDNPGTQGSNPFSEVSESPSIQDFDCDADDPQPLDIEVSNSGEPTSFTKFKESLSKAGKKLKKPETSNVPDEVIAISDEELPKESLAKTPSKSQRVTKLSLRSSNKSKGTRGLLKPELERLVKDQEDTIQRLTQELEAQRNTEYLSSRPNRNLKEMTTVQQDIKRQELVYALDASGLALDSTLQANILKDLITKPMEGGWASLHGLEDTKRVIQETVVWPLLRPDIFQGPRRPPKGIMLFGPPGTGKTMIARLIAAECGMAYFFSVSAATITSKWVGECEKTVRALFDIARVAEHCVIFLDEMESLLSTRSDKGHDSSSKIKTEFLIQLNNIMEDGSNILFIGATNKPHMIDDAVRRRLGKRLYVPLPDATARTHMLKNLLSKVDQVDLSEADFDALAAQTNHFSGADLKTLVADSLNGPLRSLPAGTDIKSVQVKDIRPVSMLDFKESLLRIKPSVNLKDVAEHVQFNKAYGCS